MYFFLTYFFVGIAFVPASLVAFELGYLTSRCCAALTQSASICEPCKKPELGGFERISVHPGQPVSTVPMVQSPNLQVSNQTSRTIPPFSIIDRSKLFLN
eukprot:4109452-Amphidinium_carterae.1